MRKTYPCKGRSLRCLGNEAGRWVTGAEHRGGVSRGPSRDQAGEASEALQAERRSNG